MREAGKELGLSAATRLAPEAKIEDSTARNRENRAPPFGFRLGKEVRRHAKLQSRCQLERGRKLLTGLQDNRDVEGCGRSLRTYRYCNICLLAWS